MTPSTGPGRRPDPPRALEQYRRRAPRYDLELLAFEPFRREAIARLDVRAGGTVLDVGCGTGLSLPGLVQKVGPRGRIVGFDPSPEMLQRARARVARHGWTGIELHLAAACDAPLPARADAALFHFTHDVLRDAASLQHVLSHLRRGAHVVACGLKWAPPWLLPANVFVLGAAYHSVSRLEGLEQPWDRLAPHLRELRVESRGWGGIYLLEGRRA